MAKFKSPPVKNTALISSLYGAHESFRSSPHRGIDFAVPTGTPVMAVDNGTVEKTWRDDAGGGNVIFLLHSNGKRTAYLHLDSFAVAQGQPVRAGQTIGLSGNTGTQHPHLHFELRDAATNERMDPAGYLPAKFTLKPALAKEVGFSTIGKAAPPVALIAALVGIYLWRRHHGK